MEKSKNRKVSVIIPTYNRAAMLKEAVDSVLAQDYPNFELIVIDDGSTDSTPKILNTYQDDVTVIRRNNLGVSRARNAGIRAASGQFIAFLDSDDLWLPQKLSNQVEFFNLNPEALICQTEEIWIRNSVRVNPKKRHKKVSGMIFEPSLELCLVSPSAVMMQRSLFETVGLFDESLPACEDYDLWLRISCRYPIHLIDTPLIIKRGGHVDQLSRLPGLDKFRIQSIINIIESNLLSPVQFNAAVQALNEKCAIYAAGCRKRGRRDEATHYKELSKKYMLKLRS
ncbi:MAG: glycosyltransferase [Candidatus Desulfatibia sp.]|uniref:glycosyltransferase family 2 protein n=1 Tax=Candidatus Desulfatibia sp. TaxID=3101189 RepID=UPI002F34E71B